MAHKDELNTTGKENTTDKDERNEHDEHDEFTKKVLKGLEKTYENLIAFKKRNNSKLIVVRDGKIVEITPE